MQDAESETHPVRVTRPKPHPRGWREFLRTRRSAVALEMAIIALPFFMMLLGVMEVAYDQFVQAALNSIVQATARQIWTTNIALSTAQSSSTFVSTYVCPLTNGLLECGLISMNTQRLVSVAQGTANITTHADFFHIGQTNYIVSGVLNTSSWTVCSGGPTSVDMLEAVYAGPTFLGGLVPAFSIKNSAGARIHPTYSSIGYGVQQFAQASSC